MKNILISIFCLKDIGGISSSLYNLLLDIHGRYNVSLCILSNFKSDKYVLPEDVKIIAGNDVLGDMTLPREYLSSQNFVRKFVRNIRRFWRKINKSSICRELDRIQAPGYYDVAIAFSDLSYRAGDTKIRYDYYFVWNSVLAKTKIAWVHNIPEAMGITRKNADGIFDGYDYIVNVSQNCKNSFDRIVSQLASKSVVVYNMFNIEEIRKKADVSAKVYENNGRVHFVTVGRVANGQKRMDRIVEVCQRLTLAGYNQFDWTVVGEGPDRMPMAKRTIELGLSGILHFVGLKINPYPYMKQADAFVLSSLYEGFSMVLKEAQILNVPTFVTEVGSAYESVLDGLQGEICDNSTEGLYQMIKGILDFPEKLSMYRHYIEAHPIANNLARKQFDKLIESADYGKE